MDMPLLTEIEQGVLFDYWLDHQFAVQNKLDISDSVTRHYHVQMDGRSVVNSDHALVSGVLLNTWRPKSTDPIDFQNAKVVVRMSLADWFAVGKHAKTLRVLNCPLVGDNGPPVLDTLLGTAVLATGIVVRNDESIRVAELFSGGFMGWGQMVSVLQHHAVPVRLKWALDCNPICARSFVAQHDHAHVVDAHSDHKAALKRQGPAFLNASIREIWWQQWQAKHPADIWCCSPPCQPWSTAGSQQGLHDGDGQLVLSVFSLIEVHQPKLVCIEEVAGFRRHPHFAVVKQIWEDIGYTEIWEQVVDLVDFAPQS